MGKKENTSCSCQHCFSEDFCLAMDTTEIPIYMIDAEKFEIVYCNKTLCRYMDRNPLGEICYKAFRELDEPCPDCVVLKILKEGINEAIEYRRPTGNWMLVKASPLCWKGKDYYKVTCTDITKQKKLEEELRFHNIEYRAVVYQSTSGIMRYDIATGVAAVNVDRRLNRVEEYLIPDYVDVIHRSGIVHSDSVSVVDAMFDDIHHGVPSHGYDIHVVLEQEESHWCHLDYTLIENEQGKPYRAVASFFDNTEQREKELAYQLWNTRMNTLMNEYAAYMEVNLSQDLIEAEGRHGSWENNSSGRCFSRELERMAILAIFDEDRFNFRSFFHRERLLGQFLAGNREGVLEYRTRIEGPLQWYRAEVQMVSDPSSGDVKASIMISNVDVDMREREHLKNEAERDIMTGLYNHATVETLIEQTMKLNTGERCCFLIIDLDDLRIINSTLGHPEGDRALKSIADCMKSQFRKSDIMGRIGGDEFVVLLRNAPEIDGLRSALATFMSQLNKIKIGPLDDWVIHASVGGTMGTAGVDDFKTLYRQADLALFYTKAMGKNGFNMYVPEFEKREFSYKPRSTASLETVESLESSEIRKLLHAVSSYCQMIVSVNLTRNTYYMLEYVSYTTQHSKDEGSFDQLIQEGGASFHPEDREEFLTRFKRENLLKAYEEGQRIVQYVGRQMGDDGIYRKMKTVVILMKEEESGDICEIAFTHVVPTEKECHRIECKEETLDGDGEDREKLT
ncbi:MAG: sensor domain-containing diguanylate cyclase [Eubacteriales bacterium]|nr:sensor domain-containing diguanylate cyclase [Eubacteriales bacterium]